MRPDSGQIWPGVGQVLHASARQRRKLAIDRHFPIVPISDQTWPNCGNSCSNLISLFSQFDHYSTNASHIWAISGAMCFDQRSRNDLRSIWGRSLVDLGSTRGRSRIELGSSWRQPGVIVGALRARLGAFGERLWADPGRNLGSMSGGCWVDLG